MKAVNVDLAHRLKAARLARGLLQKQACRALGMTKNQLTRIENAHQVVTREEVERFAALYGVQVSTLVLYADNEEEDYEEGVNYR